MECWFSVWLFLRMIFVSIYLYILLEIGILRIVFGFFEFKMLDVKLCVFNYEIIVFLNFLEGEVILIFCYYVR